MFELFSWILAGYSALLPMSNPFSTVPLLMSLTSGETAQARRSQGDRATFYGAIIMLVALFFGTLILDFFNISVPALRVAGGFIVCFFGFNMLIRQNKQEDDSQEMPKKEDYSFIPLAMPSLVGPGTLSIIMTFATQINDQTSTVGMVTGYGVMIVAIGATSLTTFFVLRSSQLIMRLLGEKGIEAMTRIMGLILVCIGVQFIADGVKGFVLAL
ncbi:MAG: MarC family NAAT transporter [Desulfofustis sp.]|nr:MarC family NAAT transporter [Desulfofustis sp.]